MREYLFQDIYELVSLIDESVRCEEAFWNYNEEFFIESSSKFSKFTLLHLYIITRAYNYHHKDFRKNGDLIDEYKHEQWTALFEAYNVSIAPYDISQTEEPVSWMDDNEEKFEELFSKMADEAFYILFNNRGFLLNFNLLVAQTIKETKYPNGLLTKKSTLKRAKIPEWLKGAVFHRDKGRCVYCNTDLTSLVNLINQKNFDHMVPLDSFGANDPCNIQLTCESCNKSKSNNNASTSFLYMPWWT